MSNVTSKYYQLSEYLQDDIYLVCHVIRSYCKTDVSFKCVFKAVESLNLDEYEDCIDDALDSGREAIIASSIGLTFRSEKEYINYLVLLLESNAVGYAPFHLASSSIDKFQGGLFNA